jgi:hypothetical protein
MCEPPSEMGGISRQLNAQQCSNEHVPEGTWALTLSKPEIDQACARPPQDEAICAPCDVHSVFQQDEPKSQDLGVLCAHCAGIICTVINFLRRRWLILGCSCKQVARDRRHVAFAENFTVTLFFHPLEGEKGTGAGLLEGLLQLARYMRPLRPTSVSHCVGARAGGLFL